jgi:hypothetical protein
MASATAMYHTNRNPLRKITKDSEVVDIVRGEKRRRLHKAFLRYHDANNWPLLREALKKMGRADLIGNGKQHLIPSYQPQTDGSYQSTRRKNSSVSAAVARNPRDFSQPEQQPRRGRLLTQHTGLPPRAGIAGNATRPARTRPSNPTAITRNSPAKKRGK